MSKLAPDTILDLEAKNSVCYRLYLETLQKGFNDDSKNGKQNLCEETENEIESN